MSQVDNISTDSTSCSIRQCSVDSFLSFPLSELCFHLRQPVKYMIGLSIQTVRSQYRDNTSSYTLHSCILGQCVTHTHNTYSIHCRNIIHIYTSFYSFVVQKEVLLGAFWKRVLAIIYHFYQNKLGKPDTIFTGRALFSLKAMISFVFRSLARDLSRRYLIASPSLPPPHTEQALATST